MVRGLGQVLFAHLLVVFKATSGQHHRLARLDAQRLAIARALLKDAPLVILDEPTSQIDVETEALLNRALERLCANFRSPRAYAMHTEHYMEVILWSGRW